MADWWMAFGHPPYDLPESWNVGWTTAQPVHHLLIVLPMLCAGTPRRRSASAGAKRARFRCSRRSLESLGVDWCMASSIHPTISDRSRAPRGNAVTDALRLRDAETSQARSQGTIRWLAGHCWASRPNLRTSDQSHAPRGSAVTDALRLRNAKRPWIRCPRRSLGTIGVPPDLPITVRARTAVPACGE